MTNGTAGDGLTGRLVVTWLPVVDLSEQSLNGLVAAFAQTTARQIDVVHACRSCGSDQHGKPQVRLDGRDAPWHVSLSRSRDLAVVAVTDTGPVGIDVEAVTRPGTDLITWVRKESLVKATGHGLAVDPDTIGLTAPSGPPGLLVWPLDEPIGSPVHMVDLDAPAGFVAAATALSDARPEVVTARAAPGG